MADIISIRILRHENTGLLMAISPDDRGFIVHAHSIEEMEEKLVSAYEAYLEATGHESGEWELRNDSVPGYWPPAFILEAAQSRAV